MKKQLFIFTLRPPFYVGFTLVIATNLPLHEFSHILFPSGVQLLRDGQFFAQGY
jgi:hypothetical protein